MILLRSECIQFGVSAAVDLDALGTCRQTGKQSQQQEYISIHELWLIRLKEKRLLSKNMIEYSPFELIGEIT
jgi:hypothetical protein